MKYRKNDLDQEQKEEEENIWKGFKLPMGFFMVWKDGEVRAGKCDPLTKAVLHWYEIKEQSE